MILFFGTRTLRKVLGSGPFRCPYCLEARAYQLVSERTWVHVFWIPVLPMGSARESVRCTVCRGSWAPAVLTADDVR